MFGDTRFYLHDPVQKKWTHLRNFDPLPDFPGRLPTQNVYPLPIINSLSLIENCKLYVCDLPDLDGSPKLHVYDLNKGKLDFSQDLPNLSLDLSLYCPNFSLSYCDWQMLALGEGLLLFLGYVEEKDDDFGEGKFVANSERFYVVYPGFECGILDWMAEERAKFLKSVKSGKATYEDWYSGHRKTNILMFAKFLLLLIQKKKGSSTGIFHMGLL